MKRLISILVIAGMLLGGCASTGQPMEQSERAKLGAVHIDDTVAKPEKMYWLGKGGLLFAAGAIGGAIIAEQNKGPGEQFKDYAEKNGVLIDNIVREEALAAFRQSGKVQLSDTDVPNDAKLSIRIVQYGFSIPTGFSSQVVPILRVKCSMVDASGKVIWEAGDGVLPLGNPVEGKLPDELTSDPKLIEAAWRAAAKSVMTSIAGKL